MNPATLPYVFSLYCSNREVERCQQKSYVLNAMARGPFHALPVAALATGLSQASSSESASDATKAANVAVMYAVVPRKSNPIHFNE